MKSFETIGQFYVHFGGAGDALLLLSTFYDDSPTSTIISICPSPDSSRSLFEAFPDLGSVYFIPYPEKFTTHIILRKLFGAMPNCLGMGVAPRDPDYFKEWGREFDITKEYGVNKNPEWVRQFQTDSKDRAGVVIQPVGGISPLDNSVRKMILPAEMDEIVGLFNDVDIAPVLIGTPDEASYFDLGNRRTVDRRSRIFGEQMELIASCSLFIGADSWGKTFAALCGKPTVVFHSTRGEKRNNLTEVGDNIFLKPWPTVTVVNDTKELKDFLNQKMELTTLLPDLHFTSASTEASQYSDSLVTTLVHARDLASAGKVDDAILLFSELLKNDPNNANILNNLGVLYFGKGDKDRAVQLFEKAVHAEPTNIDASKNLAAAYLDSGRLIESLKVYSTILSLSTDDAEDYEDRDHASTMQGHKISSGSSALK